METAGAGGGQMGSQPNTSFIALWLKLKQIDMESQRENKSREGPAQAPHLKG